MAGEVDRSAEPVAVVAADLAAGRVRCPSTVEPELFMGALGGAGDAVVVDATRIYQSLLARDRPVHIYEDHPCITPPWDRSLIAYLNEHGNVIAMLAQRTLIGKRDRKQRWDTPNEVDWGRVRWLVDVPVFAGHRNGAGEAVPAVGPLLLWRFAIYDSGEPADLRWVQLLPKIPVSDWDMAQLVILAALNFLNCSNAEAVEPARPRAQRRRLERAGVTVKTIHVFPPGPLRRGTGDRPEPVGVPLSTVRGHFASYGPEHNRGLLFGKYSGRFWRPQHAVGDPALGEHVTKGYELRPG